MTSQNELDETLYQYAAIGITWEMEEAIKQGADVNYIATNYIGEPMGSALSEAAYYHREQSVEVLLAHGAKVGLPDAPDKSTPLMHAFNAVAGLEETMGNDYAVFESGGAEAVLENYQHARKIALAMTEAATAQDFAAQTTDGKTAADYVSPGMKRAVNDVLKKKGLPTL